MNIHRASLNAQPACGATHGNISYSGKGVTCQACVEATRHSTAEEMNAYWERVAKQQAERREAPAITR